MPPDQSVGHSSHAQVVQKTRMIVFGVRTGVQVIVKRDW